MMSTKLARWNIAPMYSHSGSKLSPRWPSPIGQPGWGSVVGRAAQFGTPRPLARS
jgi:hypothetical protein